MTLIRSDLTWQNGTLRTGLDVEVVQGRVASVRPMSASATPDHVAHVLMPACTDLQVNGSGGVMLNSEPTPDGIAAIVGAQLRQGTGWVMPTLITTTLETMNAAADAMIAAWGIEGLLGLHLEGPYLNVKRKGTHNPALIRPFEAEAMDILRRLRSAGIPVMFTLAPELVGPDQLAEIAALGVVVSAGHTAANAEEAKTALAAGVRCFTHLFNAMPQMSSRDPGVIAVAINSDAYCGIIADGHHVDWEMIKLACRARPQAGRSFLVSDAMSTVGGPDHFTLYGERIEVRDGRLINANGSLAGAHITLVSSLRNLITEVGMDLAESIAMVTDIPHRAMSLEPPQIAPGLPLSQCLALGADFHPISLDQ